MPISLSAGQAVTIHGWLAARKTLAWGDVLANEKLTFSYLHQTCKISPMNLFALQPDIKAWVRNEKVALSDCPHLHPWSAHPIRDLEADLSDIARMGWSVETLHKMGVTYKDLIDVGMTPDTMTFMGLTLTGWKTLGFAQADAKNIPPAALFKIFKIPWMEVLSALSKP